MSTVIAPALNLLLEVARADARAAGLPYAGSIDPTEAWHLFSHEQAVLVDVRSAEEFRFVGHVPGSINVPWASGLTLTRNPRFLDELAKQVEVHDVVLMLCRSAKRSALAAAAATRAGYQNVFNVDSKASWTTAGSAAPRMVGDYADYRGSKTKPCGWPDPPTALPLVVRRMRCQD